MKKSKIKKILIILLLLACIPIIGIAIIYGRISTLSRHSIFSSIDPIFINEESKTEVGLILGARVYDDHSMSDSLKDRVETAVEYYNAGIFDVFLVSGDHGRIEYDEVNTVRKFLQENNIPEEKIFLDHAGFDTYDSLYRARDIFEARKVYIFTQKFHLPRAVYIAKKLGLETYGVVSDKHIYFGAIRNTLREVLARVKAWYNVQSHSTPKFLGEKIPVTGDSLQSWDEK